MKGTTIKQSILQEIKESADAAKRLPHETQPIKISKTDMRFCRKNIRERSKKV